MMQTILTGVMTLLMLTSCGTPPSSEVPNTVYLLNHVTCRAILVECGFLSNQEEEKKLVDDSYQTKIAEAIKAGIDNYFTVMAPKE